MAIAVKDQGKELVPAQSPVTLFRTEDPAAIGTAVAGTAQVLSDFVKQQKLTVKIQGNDYVLVEGWTFLGTVVGVYPVPVWTRKLENGWEARVEARTKDGSVVGAAEAMCLRSEPSWSKRPDYALRSMAQTRAVSKALRLPLGFVMKAAGYEATPAEEMVIEDAVVTEVKDTAPLCSDAQAKNVWRLINKIDKAGELSADAIREAMGKEYGTETPAELTKQQASDLITRLKVKAGEDD